MISFNFINLFLVFLLFFVTTGNTRVLKNTIVDYPQNVVLSDTTDRIIKIELPFNFIDFTLLAIEDLDNDGFDDLLFRAVENDSDAVIYIVHGDAEFKNGFDINDPNVKKTIIHLENMPYTYKGIRMIKTGDINGDGFKDFFFDSGGLYIILGKAELMHKENIINLKTETKRIFPSLSTLDIANSLILANLNNDRCDEIMIRNPSNALFSRLVPLRKGTLYVIPGSYNFPDSIDLENPQMPILKIIGEFPPIMSLCFYQFVAGDVNSDHQNELFFYGGYNIALIKPYYNRYYLINSALFSAYGVRDIEIAIDPKNTDFTRFVRYSHYVDADRVKYPGRVSGTDLSDNIAMGDINGDGFDDCIFCFHKIVSVFGDWPWQDDYSEIYVVFGKHDIIENGDLDKIPDGMIKFKSAYLNDGIGLNLTTNDINGDGFDDMVVEDIFNSTYIVFGRPTFPDTTIISDTSPFTSFIKGDKKQYTDDLDHSGRKVIPVGDINGDGYNDIRLRRKSGIYILLGTGNKYELKQTIIHPLPGATKSHVTFGFMDGTRFQFRFTKGKPTKDSELHLTQFGRTLPDSLKHIPTSNGVVSFIDAEITGLSSEFQVECSIGYTDSLVHSLSIKEGDLSIASWNKEQSQWKTIQCVVDTVRNSVTFSTDHFSLFALVDSNDPVLWVGDQESNLPLDFRLEQNYPNPFNPTTTIRFKIARFEDLKIIVYNILGQEVKTVINEQLSAGTHEVKWDGRDNFGNKVSSGIYIYRMETSNGFVKTRKMVFLK